MSSNRQHKQFDTESNLSREDIKRYQTSDNDIDKNSIERKAENSSFDSDAMEGWEALDYKTDLMKNMDKKFIPKANISIFFIGGVSILLITTIVLLSNYNVSKNYNTKYAEDINQEILSTPNSENLTIEKTDLTIPDSIESMETAPVLEQMIPTKIIQEFKDMNDEELAIEKIDIVYLPLTLINEVEEKEIILEREYGKEIYFHDLKLLDYRKYRSDSKVRTKQIVLTGTSADKESQLSGGVESEWKNIDIAYIDYINKTAKIFSKGNYKRALARYNTILASYGNDLNANFYAGLCLFNLKEYDKAISLFNKCMNNEYSNFDEEAQWMTALSYDKNGNTKKANEILINISSQNGYYASQANEILKN